MNLDEIRARAEAATEGPWYHGGDTRVSQQMFEPHELIVSPTYPIIEFQSGEQGVADAEFAAHAREDIPALLAEVERLRSAGAPLPLEPDTPRSTWTGCGNWPAR
jgi:hypothetical protein